MFLAKILNSCRNSICVFCYLPALHVLKDMTATKQTKESKTSNLTFRDVIFTFSRKNMEMNCRTCLLKSYLFPEKDNTYNFWHNFTKNPVRLIYITNLFPSRGNIFCFECCDWFYTLYRSFRSFRLFNIFICYGFKRNVLNDSSKHRFTCISLARGFV